jgi:uncharacterized Ntn-hydrolase superfamily protein
MKALLVCLLLVTAMLQAQTRPVHTFSIVARDPQTGTIGVAVESHWFSVGSIVPWAEPGVGAVATQSFADASYGPLGLALMRAGKSAPDALKGLLAADTGAEVRQVAMIDAEGRVAVWTGGKDIEAAGHVTGAATSGWSSPGNGHGSVGENFAAQANLMANDKVWPAMANAFQQTQGDLAERMLAALDAAQAAGGDIRGKQSAALIVVSGIRGTPWDRLFDVRVDDALDPLRELRRLVSLQRAYNHMNAGDDALEHHDQAAALREYTAAEQIASSTPDLPQSRLAEMTFWHAVALVNMKRVDEALLLFRKAFTLEPRWRSLAPRLPHSGLLPDDPNLIARITAQ